MRHIYFYIILFIIFSLFYPISTKNYYTIHTSFIEAVNYINNPKQWQKWYKPFNHSSILLEKINIGEKTKKTVFKNSINYTLYQFSPTSYKLEKNTFFEDNIEIALGYQSLTEVLVIEKTEYPFFKYIYYLLNKNERSNSSIVNNLKIFLENPTKLYGFNIKKSWLPHTSFILLTKNIYKENKLIEAKKMLNLSIKLALKANVVLSEKEMVYLSYRSLYNDSTLLSTLLPVKSNDLIKSEVYYFEMPKKGNVLYLHYKGVYKEAFKAYDVLRKYAIDHSLTDKFWPFEKFKNNKLPKSDYDIVDMYIYYPCY